MKFRRFEYFCEFLRLCAVCEVPDFFRTVTTLWTVYLSVEINRKHLKVEAVNRRYVSIERLSQAMSQKMRDLISPAKEKHTFTTSKLNLDSTSIPRLLRDRKPRESILLRSDSLTEKERKRDRWLILLLHKLFYVRKRSIHEKMKIRFQMRTGAIFFSDLSEISFRIFFILQLNSIVSKIPELHYLNDTIR